VLHYRDVKYMDYSLVVLADEKYHVPILLTITCLLANTTK